jgi:hypothetical protein
MYQLIVAELAHKIDTPKSKQKDVETYLENELAKLVTRTQLLFNDSPEIKNQSFPFLYKYGTAASSLSPIRRDMLLGKKDTRVMVISSWLQSIISEDADNPVDRCKEHLDGSLICYSSKHFSPRKTALAPCRTDTLIHKAWLSVTSTNPSHPVPAGILTILPKDIRTRQGNLYRKIPVTPWGAIDLSDQSYPCVTSSPYRYLETSKWKRWLSAINLNQARTNIVFDDHTDLVWFILKTPHFLVVSPLCLEQEQEP